MLKVKFYKGRLAPLEKYTKKELIEELKRIYDENRRYHLRYLQSIKQTKGKVKMSTIVDALNEK